MNYKSAFFFVLWIIIGIICFVIVAVISDAIEKKRNGIKIIKQGINPLITFKHKCNRCGCIVEYEKNFVDISFPLKYDCPSCNIINYICSYEAYKMDRQIKTFAIDWYDELIKETKGEDTDE